MKMKKIYAVCALTACMSAQAEGMYVEAGYGAMKYTEPSLSMTPTVARGIFGVNVNDYLAIEAMAATGLSGGTTTYSGVGINLKVRDAAGVYVVPKVKLGDSIELFGRAGYTNISGSATLTGSRGSLVLDMNGGDTSFGAGLRFNFAKNMYATVDYMSYYSKDSISVKGYTVGVGLSF